MFDIYLLLYVQSLTPDDRRKDRPKHVECYSKINKFKKLVHPVGITTKYITTRGPMNVEHNESLECPKTTVVNLPPVKHF